MDINNLQKQADKEIDQALKMYGPVFDKIFGPVEGLPGIKETSKRRVVMTGTINKNPNGSDKANYKFSKEIIDNTKGGVKHGTK